MKKRSGGTRKVQRPSVKLGSNIRLRKAINTAKQRRNQERQAKIREEIKRTKRASYSRTDLEYKLMIIKTFLNMFKKNYIKIKNNSELKENYNLFFDMLVLNLYSFIKEFEGEIVLPKYISDIIFPKYFAKDSALFKKSYLSNFIDFIDILMVQFKSAANEYDSNIQNVLESGKNANKNILETYDMYADMINGIQKEILMTMRSYKRQLKMGENISMNGNISSVNNSKMNEELNYNSIRAASASASASAAARARARARAIEEDTNNSNINSLNSNNSENIMSRLFGLKINSNNTSVSSVNDDVADLLGRLGL
jgi:hypothetical protein